MANKSFVGKERGKYTLPRKYLMIQKYTLT